METFQSDQRHIGLTHRFLFLTLGHYDAHAVLSARMPECQRIKNGGLGQCGPERFRV